MTTCMVACRSRTNEMVGKWFVNGCLTDVFRAAEEAQQHPMFDSDNPSTRVTRSVRDFQ